MRQARRRMRFAFVAALRHSSGMTPADLLLETAARAARALPEPAPLLAACRAAAEAVRAAFDHLEDPGGALAMDLERLLGRLAMLTSWCPEGPMPREGETARFMDFARPELAIIAAVNVQRTAEAIISERRAERPHAWPRMRIIQGYGGLIVTMRYFVPTEPGWEPAGDLGGDGDRKIADAARHVTRKTEPEDVMQALADLGPDPRKSGVPWCAICNSPVKTVDVSSGTRLVHSPVRGARGYTRPSTKSVTVTCHGQEYRATLSFNAPLPDVFFAPLADAAAEREFCARASEVTHRDGVVVATDENGNVVQIHHLSAEDAAQAMMMRDVAGSPTG